ncbi:MAG: alcohol dehydrogenase [Denitrovibrio sp.]|nr:MAG: alcohol dehydrogenase [Denitrovibrio sp.]
MKAMVLSGVTDLIINSKPLSEADITTPTPTKNQVLIRISASGASHIELEEIEGKNMPSVLPIIPGHQAVGMVEDKGEDVTKLEIGDRVGVSWIFSSCGTCDFCLRGDENLCDEFKATGLDADGTYAEFIVIDEDHAYPIPDSLNNNAVIPLLFAGAIGYRSLRFSSIESGQKLGLSGFGMTAMIILKLLANKTPGVQVFVFSRSEAEQEAAKNAGAFWTGAIDADSPEKLDVIIDTTPIWSPVVKALENLKKGGKLIINETEKDDQDRDALLKLTFHKHLSFEKEIKTITNISRTDVINILDMASTMDLQLEYEEYNLSDANRAINDLKNGKMNGSKILIV